MNRRDFLISSAIGAAAGLLGGPALAQTTAITSKLDSSQLKPGQFLWEPDLSLAGPVMMIVSLPDQLVHVYRNGVEIGLSTCSSGKPGHETPTGVFVILQKDKDHHSSTYDNAPMPNMQRLTWSGIALHAGNLPGYPASHGCVRLPKQFSEIIFGITQLGIAVIIADGKSQPAAVVHPGLLLPDTAEAEGTEAEMAAAKRPPTSVDNVASGIVSAADRKVFMLIDGRVAWESPIDILDPGQPLGDHAYSFLGPTPDRSAFRWTAHDLGGSRQVRGDHDAILSRIKVAKSDEATGILLSSAPGATLVVTDRSATQATRSDPGFVVIDAEV
jgi:hypothetical protein